jgi:hypothetical protein
VAGGGKELVGLLGISLGSVDGVMGGSADAQHGANVKDQIINGQSQIQGGQTAGAQSVRNKKGVRQDVAGESQGANGVQGGIPSKLAADGMVFHRGDSFLSELKQTKRLQRGDCTTTHRKFPIRLHWMRQILEIFPRNDLLFWKNNHIITISSENFRDKIPG